MIAFLVLGASITTLVLTCRRVPIERVAPDRGLRGSHNQPRKPQPEVPRTEPLVLFEPDPACRACAYDKAFRGDRANDAV